MSLARALTLLTEPRGASACAVCFGGADGRSGLANGFWWGIVILLLITMSLVGAIGWTIWTVEKRRAVSEG
jgi:hypothetical protein